ncbi:MAG: CpsD/CapB family tyrosine-protein kinase [Pseudomonadota bacterium]
MLEEIRLDPKQLERNRIITQNRQNPAYVAFDVLRTRILRTFAKHGWSRVGITSPTKGCGKTFTAANLTLSLARQKDCRTVLIDLDLRAPNMAQTLGVSQPEPISWFLSGDVPTQEALRRVDGNLALGLNDKKIPNAAETLLSPAAGKAMDDMCTALEPDIVVYDLPPMLSCDDVLGLLPQLDCILLVVGGGITRPDEITECERLLADQTHLLGVLLNKGEDAKLSRYGYEG